MFKASVIKLSENAHIFIITVHHSICDGLSIDVFLEELGVIYSAYVQDKLPNLPEVDPYSLFAEKENLFAESNEYKLSEARSVDGQEGFIDDLVSDTFTTFRR